MLSDSSLIISVDSRFHSMTLSALQVSEVLISHNSLRCCSLGCMTSKIELPLPLDGLCTIPERHCYRCLSADMHIAGISPMTAASMTYEDGLTRMWLCLGSVSSPDSATSALNSAALIPVQRADNSPDCGFHTNHLATSCITGIFKSRGRLQHAERTTQGRTARGEQGALRTSA